MTPEKSYPFPGTILFFVGDGWLVGCIKKEKWKEK